MPQFQQSSNQINDLIDRISDIKASIQKNQQQQKNLNQQELSQENILVTQHLEKFKQIQKEIDELKKSQNLDVKINDFGVIIQEKLANLFIFIKEQTNGQLLNKEKTQLLIEKFIQEQNQEKINAELIQIQQAHQEAKDKEKEIGNEGQGNEKQR